MEPPTISLVWDDASAAPFENILNDVDEINLIDAASHLEGVKYRYGQTQEERTFKLVLLRAQLDGCLVWASSHSLAADLAGIDRNLLAAIRAWTGDISYVLTSLLRDKDRTKDTIRPALPFLRLLYRGLHKLPPRFLYEGNLYRGETGVRSNWDTVSKPGSHIQLFCPASFSTAAEVADEFMRASGIRSLTEISRGWGYRITELSLYPEESEILTESILHVKVESSASYDESHAVVKLNPVTNGHLKGLHHLQVKQVLGTPLLAGSPVREKEQQAHGCSLGTAASDPGPLPLQQWLCQHVVWWLREINLHDLQEIAVKEKINGKILRKMADVMEVRKLLPTVPLGYANELADAVTELKEKEAARELLRQACEDRSIEALRAAIQAGKAANVADSEMKQAAACSRPTLRRRNYSQHRRRRRNYSRHRLRTFSCDTADIF
eukprot:TRINITY_DN1851_c0_g1_i2.p1 TRINITY_DN1851_c0_g1~~TRINITY_DN1851_c0_g1_i2.p1  ORF type:complete len:438 (-),score=44.49 TRINITY_DN1851_c0_g1_i2:1267-2580(-)